MRRRVRLLALLAVIPAGAACRGGLLGGGGSAATAATPPDSVVTELCLAVTSAYRPAHVDGPSFEPNHDHGLHLGWSRGEQNLFFRLRDRDPVVRHRAAWKLLSRAPTRASATLEAAIAVSGSAGDFAVLPYLEGIVTNRFPSGDDDDCSEEAGAAGNFRAHDHDGGGETCAGLGGGNGETQPASHGGGGHGHGEDPGDDGGSDRPSPHPIATSFEIGARVAAAAAIGRIVELDHPHAIPEPKPGEPTETEAAIAALEVGSCDPRIELRSASLEALGLIRDPAAKPFLDTVVANPAAGNDFQNLFLQTVAARSLTNITLNNHVQTLGLQPRIDAAFQQAQSTMVTP